MSSVVIVPGPAVRSFVIPAADALAAARHQVRPRPIGDEHRFVALISSLAR